MAAAGKPGPKPLPAEVVALRGNPGKRSRPEESKPRVGVLKKPTGLPPAAAKKWEELVAELDAMGLLYPVDGTALELACIDYAIAMEALALLRDTRKATKLSVLTKDRTHGGEPRRHPATMIYRQHADAFAKWCSKFGLTPSDRVGLPGPAGDDDEDDDVFD